MTDETNVAPGAHVEFFIYGGLLVDAEQLPELHAKIRHIRAEAGLSPQAQLKFGTNRRPEGMSPADHAEVKSEVLAACADTNAKFLAYLIPHGIVANQSAERVHEFALNTVLYAFWRYLEAVDGYGQVLIDRFSNQNQGLGILRDRFANGLRFEGGHRHMIDDRVLTLGATADGASYMSSAVDIALGSFRYAVNERNRKEVPSRLLRAVAELMWYQERDGSRHLREHGLYIRPRQIQAAVYSDMVESLLEHLKGLLELTEAKDH